MGLKEKFMHRKFFTPRSISNGPSLKAYSLVYDVNWVRKYLVSIVYTNSQICLIIKKIHPALAWSVHMSGKSQTIRDFTFCWPSQICRYWSDLNRQKSVPDTPDIEFGGKEWKVRQKLKFVCCTQMYDRETGSQQFRGVVMSEIHRRRLRRYKFQFSFAGNDRRPSQKSGKCRENRKRSRFSRFVSVHPKWSGICAISSF